MYVGQSVPRVDAYDKAAGRAPFTGDLCPKDALTARILHANISHGYVKSIDTAEAEALPGVVKVLTCFDVPDFPFATDGHPWHVEPPHDNMDRLLLNRHVRYCGDEVAAVIAVDEMSAARALRAIRVEYEVLPFVLNPRKAMAPGAPQLFNSKPRNLCGETHSEDDGYHQAAGAPGLLRFDNWYHTPMVQHCHLENHICFAYSEGGKLTVCTSTQIPHIVRRIVGQALGIPWGKVRIIKPYVGGGFGNKQDALYEPLCAWLSVQVGGRCVVLDCSREETFVSNRVRHPFDIHLITHVRPDGTLAARQAEIWSRQGAYTSHGHGVLENAISAFANLYPRCPIKADGWTVYTNTPTAGAMRGYGFPQITFAVEAQMEEIARSLAIDGVALRRKNAMPVGFVDGFNRNENYFDSVDRCLDLGCQRFGWSEKKKANLNQTGSIRPGIGCAIFFYTAGVWPVCVESASCRMVLNQDGSVQLQLPETEIGQGADTAFSQMAADALGIPLEAVHIVSIQDTDVTPYGMGAYASRQTYVASFSIRQTAELLKNRILEQAQVLTRQSPSNLTLRDGKIVRVTDGRILMTLGELSTQTLYSLDHSVHLTAETTADVKNNAFHFGCSFAEVEVDIPLCKVKLLRLLNVHDAGTLINPRLAEAQVHGGMSMSIGFALSEQLLLDDRTGRPLNGNLLDYKVSTALDHPDLEACFIECPEPTSGFGNRSLGDPPAVSGAPAIRNAILDATGVAVNRLPANPHELYCLFREKGLL